jgi:hypothetical protein
MSSGLSKPNSTRLYAQLKKSPPKLKPVRSCGGTPGIV